MDAAGNPRAVRPVISLLVCPLWCVLPPGLTLRSQGWASGWTPPSWTCSTTRPTTRGSCRTHTRGCCWMWSTVSGGGSGGSRWRAAASNSEANECFRADRDQMPGLVQQTCVSTQSRRFRGAGGPRHRRRAVGSVSACMLTHPRACAGVAPRPMQVTSVCSSVTTSWRLHGTSSRPCCTR